MKIKDIYKSPNKCFVSLTAAALCVVITLITAAVPDIYTSLTYAYPVTYPWQLISGIFVHGSPNMTAVETCGNLGFNLLLVLPFGMLIEKMIGSKKFLILFLILWVINALTFYIIAIVNTPAGEHSYGAGISGIAFAYGAIGLYTLIKLLRQDWKTALKQVSFYLLLNIAVIMLIMINPVVAGVSSMIMHLVSVLTGVGFLIIRHRDIDEFIAG